MLPIKQFQEFIAQHQLFTEDSKILLAVSGGKDSVLMLHLFKAIGVNIGVAHCNFNLRADEAQRDENFVKMLAANFDIPFYVTHFETKKYAAQNKISTQMAARALRYNWFEEIREQEGYHFTALAHHQNDTVETILINLTRGTGISGLHGILPKRGKLIRPLLFLNRNEINKIVEDERLDFVEDSSNLSTDYTRNKIRLKVIPQLQEINPQLEKTFVDNAARFAEMEQFLNLYIEELAEKNFKYRNGAIYIPLKFIAKLNPQKLLFFELLKPFGFTESGIEEILNHLHATSGTQFLSASHQLTIDRENAIITELHVNGEISNEVIHPNTTSVLFAKNSEISLSFSNQNQFEIDKDKAFIDADRLVFPLILRSWQQGDKFIPLGMTHFKKLSDFFIDEKLPLHLKNLTPILINGNGDVVWIAGMRQDNRYKLTPATKKVAIFELKRN